MRFLNLLFVLPVFIATKGNAVEQPRDGNDAFTELVEKVREMEKYIKNQDKRIQDLEELVEVQKIEIEQLKESFNDVQQDKEELHAKNMTRDSKSVITRQNSVLRGGRQSEPKVAFSSFIDHVIKHIGINSIIAFDQVLINDGGSYNKLTGVFTVPISGVYLFTYTINTNVEAYQLVVKLVLDGVNMSDGTSDPFHPLQEIQGGNTVIFRANQGQSVWLAAYNIGDTTADSLDDHRFCTFSGTLLYT